MTLPFIGPFHHYIVTDMSDCLDQTTRPTFICLYPSYWNVQDIKENWAIQAEGFGLNADFYDLNIDFCDVQVSYKKKTNVAVSVDLLEVLLIQKLFLYCLMSLKNHVAARGQNRTGIWG